MQPHCALTRQGVVLTIESWSSDVDRRVFERNRELSPAGRVMGSRNSNRYVHTGGCFGSHVQALPARDEGSLRRTDISPHLNPVGSMDAAPTVWGGGRFFVVEVEGG